MVEPIVFFDIPSFAKGKAWSPNTWKVRYVRDLELMVIGTDAVLQILSEHKEHPIQDRVG